MSDKVKLRLGFPVVTKSPTCYSQLFRLYIEGVLEVDKRLDIDVRSFDVCVPSDSKCIAQLGYADDQKQPICTWGLQVPVDANPRRLPLDPKPFTYMRLLPMDGGEPMEKGEPAVAAGHSYTTGDPDVGRPSDRRGLLPIEQSTTMDPQEWLRRQAAVASEPNTTDDPYTSTAADASGSVLDPASEALKHQQSRRRR